MKQNVSFHFWVPYPLNANHQLNIVILKHFRYYKIFCKIFSFSSQISLKTLSIKIVIIPVFSLKFKRNLLHCLFSSRKRFFFFLITKIFVSFVKSSNLICKVFIEAEMIFLCKYPEFRIVWLKIFSNEFLHSSSIQIFFYKTLLVQDANLMFFSQVNK